MNIAAILGRPSSVHLPTYTYCLHATITKIGSPVATNMH
jgi:hypothetical protein